MINMKKDNLAVSSLLQAGGVFVYILFVAGILFKAKDIFPQTSQYLVPVAFLLLFVVSAAITGLLVLGRPIILYLNGAKKEGAKLFSYTIGWLALMGIMVFIILAAVK